MRAVSVGEAHALHRRLLTGEDPTAPHDVANMYLDNLTEWLIALNPRVHPHDCSTAAENAILTYIKSPQKYQPQRQTPEVYLRVSAKNKLRNILRSERLYTKHLVNIEAVDKSPTLRKSLRDEASDPAIEFEGQEEAEERTAEFEASVPDPVRSKADRNEMKVLELMQTGERKTTVFAAALEILHLPFKEQQKQVKRVKDRMKKRLDRTGGEDNG